MTFKESLQKLGIAEYEDRIYNSSSHGELSHLFDYILLAEQIKDPSWFPEWFRGIIEEAQAEWERPESVFQHIPAILKDCTNNSK